MKISLVDRSQYQVPIALLFTISIAGTFAIPWVLSKSQKDTSVTGDGRATAAVLNTDSRSNAESLSSPIAQKDSPAIEQVTIRSANPSSGRTPAKSLKTSPALQTEQNQGNPKLDREQWLIKSLNASEPFRVRVNAALDLGNINSVESTSALIRTLEDPEPAVRAAAASSLKRIGTTEALRAVARLQSRETVQGVSRAAVGSTEAVRDSAEPPKEKSTSHSTGNTPTKRARRFSVHVGAPRSYIAGLSKDLLGYAHGVVTNSVGRLNGVRLVSAAQVSDSDSASNTDGRSRAYSLDLSITGLEKTEKGIRAAVSVVLSTHPGKNIRATIRGAAAAPKSGSEEKQKRQAIDGAIRSTLGKLRQVMVASASRS